MTDVFNAKFVFQAKRIKAEFEEILYTTNASKELKDKAADLLEFFDCMLEDVEIVVKSQDEESIDFSDIYYSTRSKSEHLKATKS